MERRKAITTAAAASLTLLAGAAGIALNSGIVGAGDDGTIGQISPVSTAAPPVTIFLDDARALAPAPPVRPTTSEPVTTSEASPAPEGDDDGEHESAEHESAEHESEDDEHEDDEREEDEHEGADDDD